MHVGNARYLCMEHNRAKLGHTSASWRWQVSLAALEAPCVLSILCPLLLAVNLNFNGLRPVIPLGLILLSHFLTPLQVTSYDFTSDNRLALQYFSLIMGFKYVTICVALIAVDHALASHTLIQRAAHDIHQRAVRHTHNLAQDLRIAFGGMLIPRAAVEQPNHVVYCKSGKQAPFGTGPSGGGNSSATSSGTQPASTGGSTNAGGLPASSTVTRTGFSTTSSGSSPTGAPSSSTPSSQWSLAESHVCIPFPHSLSTSRRVVGTCLLTYLTAGFKLLQRLEFFHRFGPNKWCAINSMPVYLCSTNNLGIVNYIDQNTAVSFASSCTI